MMKTNNLILRKFNLNDKEKLISLLNDKAVTKWIELPYPYLDKHADWWLNTGSKEKYHYALTEKHNDNLVGSLKITIRGEIGCWIGKKYWNKGYAFEAVEEIKKFGFKKLKLEKIWAATHKENESPQIVLKKCGFKSIGDKPYHVEGIGDTKIRPHYEITKSP
jgi:ribosomal-protein-alanine N-acetyltransferase